MTHNELDTIAEDALNAAVAAIQAAVGQTDGGFAALWFTGERERILKSILINYARAEVENL